jgi:SDR family mycofactocin-dependent oxidoreductase
MNPDQDRVESAVRLRHASALSAVLGRKERLTMRLEGKVAFISGVARGQGRSHAVRLAEEGADIIGFDVCDQIASVRYPLASLDDLNETVKLVEDRGRRIVARKADVRDLGAVRAVFEDGIAEFGRIDIVLANAGAYFGPLLPEVEGVELGPIMEAWHDSVDVMLTGVVNTVAVALPKLISQGDGGSIVITSSTAGLKGMTGPANSVEAAIGMVGYPAAKHGVLGLMKAWAGSLAHLNIRVNAVHPTGVNTPFIVNDYFSTILAGVEGTALQNALPVELIEPLDVSNAIVWLCSEEARYVTGISLPVDAGFLVK